MLNIWDNGRRNLCVHLVTKLVLSYTIWYGLFGNDEVGGPNPPSSSTAKAPRSLTAGLFCPRGEAGKNLHKNGLVILFKK